ncbi:MAG: tRNA-dihydrouridine synthase [Planctomycetes bacterium]|nr:tRNA-dihydrouridine synthase [Planctomycetota bacterium]
MKPLHIGSLTIPGPFLMAPMSGYSSAVDRAIAREHGAHACLTELVSAKGLVFSSRRTRSYLQRAPGEDPFWVQLFGGEIESMAEAARIAAAHGAEILDVNMGCPVRKVTSGGAGVALMADPERAAGIVRAMRAATDGRVPVTAKFRAGRDREDAAAVAFGRRLEAAGAAALILHPRPGREHHSGPADWTLVRRLREAVAVPVIGSGGIRVPEDGYRMLEETGCDGAMVGRAALGNPWIFTGLRARRRHVPTPAERLAVVLDHFGRFATLVGDATTAVRMFRARALFYSRGLEGGAAYRAELVRVREPAALEDMFRRFFGRAEQVPGYVPGHGRRPGED